MDAADCECLFKGHLRLSSVKSFDDDIIIKPLESGFITFANKLEASYYPKMS